MSGSRIVGKWRELNNPSANKTPAIWGRDCSISPHPLRVFWITFYCTTVHHYLADWNRPPWGLHSIPLILVSCSSRPAEAFDGPFPKIPAGCVRVVREVDLQRDKLKLRENEQQKTRNLSRNNDAKRVE